MLRNWNLIEIYVKSVHIENVSQFHCGCARTLESQYIRIKIKDLNDVKIDLLARAGLGSRAFGSGFLVRTRALQLLGSRALGLSGFRAFSGFLGLSRAFSIL